MTDSRAQLQQGWLTAELSYSRDDCPQPPLLSYPCNDRKDAASLVSLQSLTRKLIGGGDENATSRITGDQGV